MRTVSVLLPSLALGAASLAASQTHAAENAAGIYLLGTKSSMAGFVPPPSTYFVDVNYFYSGDASGNAAVVLLFGGSETACSPICPHEP